jgi:tRNA (cmo5U34)-methyltransferase
MATFFDKNVDKYEELHLAHIDGGLDIKRSIAQYIPKTTTKLLDLGIGTGLELEAIFKKYPNIEVHGVDFSKKMIHALNKKYPNNKIKVDIKNYFKFDFKVNKHDVIISSMSLHHFLFKDKLALYRKIYIGLKNKGCFINCDYIIDDEKEEKKALNDYLKIQATNKMEIGTTHLDIPMTLQHELKILKLAGFKDIKVMKKLPRTKLIVCKKK